MEDTSPANGRNEHKDGPGPSCPARGRHALPQEWVLGKTAALATSAASVVVEAQALHLSVDAYGGDTIVLSQRHHIEVHGHPLLLHWRTDVAFVVAATGLTVAPVQFHATGNEPLVRMRVNVLDLHHSGSWRGTSDAIAPHSEYILPGQDGPLGLFEIHRGLGVFLDRIVHIVPALPLGWVPGCEEQAQQ